MDRPVAVIALIVVCFTIENLAQSWPSSSASASSEVSPSTATEADTPSETSHETESASATIWETPTRTSWITAESSTAEAYSSATTDAYTTTTQILVETPITTWETTSTSWITDGACDPRSRPLELTGASGVFTSFNYPGNYVDNSDCQWRIMATELSATVTLDFDFFSTESCCDVVNIYDGESTKSPLLVSLSGNFSSAPVGLNSTQRYLFIRFTTDYSITDIGFSATYRSNSLGDPCSSLSRPLDLSGYSGTFASAGFPSDYQNDADCQWRITAWETNGVVELTFESFSTESCCDIVTIHDGDSTKSRIITSLSGSYDSPPGGISSTQRFMFVRFITDWTDTFSGFKATYAWGDPCSLDSRPLQLLAPRGTLASSHFPSNYDNDADCQWLITAVESYGHVSLDFTEFSTESCCDFVNIHDGNSTKTRLLSSLSGAYVTPPRGLNTTQRYMYIRFSTDASITYRGFSATYVSTTAGDPCSPDSRPLDLTGTSGTFASANFPSHYDNGADCQWRIIAVDINEIIVLNFTVFDTESCCDKLTLNDGESSKAPLIVTLSGTFVTPPGGFQTTQRYMFLRFVSDESITGRGFAAAYISTLSGSNK